MCVWGGGGGAGDRSVRERDLGVVRTSVAVCVNMGRGDRVPVLTRIRCHTHTQHTRSTRTHTLHAHHTRCRGDAD